MKNWMRTAVVGVVWLAAVGSGHPGSAASKAVPDVLSALVAASDEADEQAFLMLVGEQARQGPRAALTVACIATTLAPWWSAEVLDVVLSLQPDAERRASAPALLAGVLASNGGRSSERLLAVVRRVAPQADQAALGQVAEALGLLGGSEGFLDWSLLSAESVLLPSGLQNVVLESRSAALAALRAVNVWDSRRTTVVATEPTESPARRSSDIPAPPPFDLPSLRASGS